MNENNTPGDGRGPEQPRPEDAAAASAPDARTPVPDVPTDVPAPGVAPAGSGAPWTPNHGVPSTPSAPSAAPTGHEIPAVFGSHDEARWQPPAGAPSPTAGPAAPQQPVTNGAAFGHPAAAYGAPAQGFPAPQASAPTLPVDPSLLHAPGGATSSQRKPGGGVRIAAFVLAAALVGGAAGFGGSAIGNAVFGRQVSSTESGPQTVTVNNPGSVNETTAIATRVLPSVVTIEASGGQVAGGGSGVILDEEGHVLTNNHVVTLGGATADATLRVTTSDGRIFSATVVGTDPVYDLAVIKLEDADDLTPIEFADSSKLNVGDTTVALGAPLGLSSSVTTGVVSALNRSIQVASSAAPEAPGDNPQEDPDNGQGGPFQFDIPGLEDRQQASQAISIAVIQTDAAINHGNSGGALVDSKGRLIGINVAIASAGDGAAGDQSGSIGIGFSIPSNIAKRISDEIIENGAATHGLLGTTVSDAAAAQDATVAGARIADPTPGGAAQKAGLRTGDIITEFNGVPITGATDLTAQVRAAAAGSDATLVYVRGGETFEAEVTLGELAP